MKLRFTRGPLGAVVVGTLWVLAAACSDAESPTGPNQPPADPLPEVLRLPVVVHVVHHGEPVGTGANLSDARIQAQIRILNEDFRREPGTPGFNDDPVGGDARIDFVLATTDPSGAATPGIVRIDASRVVNPVPPDHLFEHFAYYSYWAPDQYVNVWTMPLPEAARDIVLGFATGPETDLPGADLLVDGEPVQPEGILVNAVHFGSSSMASPHNQGRTLTHEMGHYLGLLHLWGNQVCGEDDFVEDTPPVVSPITSCALRSGCSGVPTQSANYMTYAGDGCMNVFTVGQIERMRHVLQTSPLRKELTMSPALAEPEQAEPLSARGPHLPGEPCLREAPVALHGHAGDAEDLRRLGHAESCEVP